MGYADFIADPYKSGPSKFYPVHENTEYGQVVEGLRLVGRLLPAQGVKGAHLQLLKPYLKMPFIEIPYMRIEVQEGWLPQYAMWQDIQEALPTMAAAQMQTIYHMYPMAMPWQLIKKGMPNPGVLRLSKTPFEAMFEDPEPEGPKSLDF